VTDLLDRGEAAQAIGLISNLSPERRTDVLSVPDTLVRLANNGQAHALARLISELSQEQREKVLAVPGARPSLAANGIGEEELVAPSDDVSALTRRAVQVRREQDARLFQALREASVAGALYVVEESIENGQPDKAVAFIGTLSPERQTEVLSVSGTVTRLANNGQARVLARLISELSPEQQAAVLAVPGAMQGLTGNGALVLCNGGKQ
jgi:hypothetical protein